MSGFMIFAPVHLCPDRTRTSSRAYTTSIAQFIYEEQNCKITTKTSGAWHGNLAKSNDGQKFFFKKSGFPEFRQKTGEEKQDIWIIRELLSGAELIKEGREMRHCVASYARSCSLGHCSIWAMGYVSAKGNIEKHQTIEITIDKHILQSRGKSNRLPTPSEFNIIMKWAQTAGLTIATYVTSR